MYLKEISTIQTGVFAKPMEKGKIIYLQAKHFDDGGNLKFSLQPDLDYDDINKKHLLRKGDIVFAAKGTKNFAACFEYSDRLIVASTSFFVIRLEENFHNKILPDFLVWFLNQQNTQKILKGKAIGTSMLSISKVVLEELEVLIPSIEVQKSILQISKLRNNEKELKEKIELLREKQIQQQISKAIK